MSSTDAEIYKAKQILWRDDVPMPQALQYQTDDPVRVNSLNRLGLLLLTQVRLNQGATPKAKLKAERKAKQKSVTMLSEEQFASFELSGSFWEQSPNRKFRYLIRKNRPTLAFRVRMDTGLFPEVDVFELGIFSKVEKLRIICALCIHPIGYHTLTFAGILTPTDEVINVVQLIRQDERGFWKNATLHKITEPVAGIG